MNDPIPDYDELVPKKSCRRCGAAIRPIRGDIYCSSCTGYIKEELRQSGYLQEIPPPPRWRQRAPKDHNERDREDG